MRGIDIKSKRTGVPGWHTESEEDALVALVQGLSFPPDGQVTIVELGGEYGRSASEFAYALFEKGRDGHVYTVDTFTDTHPIVGNLLEAYTSNLKECKLAQYVTPIKGGTVMQAQYWKKPIDLLFIDAGHSYLSVKGDITAWTPFVKPSGIVVFHDYAKDQSAHVTHLEVKRAVDEWFRGRESQWTRHNGPDSLVWFVNDFHVEHEDSPKTITARVVQSVAPELPDYTKLSYKELRALGEKRGIDAKKKNDIIAALGDQDIHDLFAD